MTEARLDVAIGSSGTVSGGSAVNRAVDQVKNNFIDLAAKVFVAQQALDRVWRMANQGAQTEESINRLNFQMRQLGSTATVMIDAMKNVTNGQLSMAQSATMASRALAVGLSPDQITVFTQAAEAMSGGVGTWPGLGEHRHLC